MWLIVHTSSMNKIANIRFCKKNVLACPLASTVSKSLQKYNKQVLNKVISLLY